VRWKDHVQHTRAAAEFAAVLELAHELQAEPRAWVAAGSPALLPAFVVPEVYILTGCMGEWLASVWQWFGGAWRQCDASTMG